jgi:hypothetical protein
VQRHNLGVFLLFLVSLAVLPPAAEGVTCKRTGAFGQQIVYDSPASDRCYRLSWNFTETKRGSKVIKRRIDYDSVCHNYPEGSIDHRNCRHQAQHFFRDNCSDLKEKYKKTKRPYNEKYRLDLDCFCEAGCLYRP